MSEDYLTAKILEALKATDGDKKDAQKLLITWAVRDQALLLGFAKPHLKALVANRIEQVSRGGKKKETEGPDHLELASIAHTKGEKRHQAKVPPPKTSERQASVMHQLAAAFKKKK